MPFLTGFEYSSGALPLVLTVLLVDTVLLGPEAWDPERHRRLTGLENRPTHAFAQQLAALQRSIWVRVVPARRVTDGPQAIASIARGATKLRNAGQVDVLQFRQGVASMGKSSS